MASFDVDFKWEIVDTLRLEIELIVLERCEQWKLGQYLENGCMNTNWVNEVPFDWAFKLARMVLILNFI